MPRRVHRALSCVYFRADWMPSDIFMDELTLFSS